VVIVDVSRQAEIANFDGGVVCGDEHIAGGQITMHEAFLAEELLEACANAVQN
jgi:hypothetical protein